MPDELAAELADLRRQLAAEPTCQASVLDSASGNCQWRSLIANSPLIVAVVDKDHIIRYLNRTETHIPANELLGKPIYEFSLPGEQSELRGRLDKVFTTGHHDFSESRAIREDGQEHWFQCYFGPIFVDERVVAVSVAVVNISAHKEAEHERDRAKAILAAAIDCLPFVFFALGNEGRYILQNSLSREQYGDMIGKRPEDLASNAKDLAIWQEYNRRAFAGDRIEGEYSTPSSLEGEIRHYYNAVTPIRDAHNQYGILGINIDITRRKNAEDALQKAHDHLETKVHERTVALQAANEALRQTCDELQAIYEGMSDGLVIAHPESQSIIYANRAICQLLGYEESEFLQTTIQQRHPADDLPRILESTHAMAEGRITHLDNVPLCHRDGGLVYFDASFQRIFYRELPCVVIFLHDVTQARLARAVLERQQRTLQHMLQASDHERQLIAYDIHDGLAQNLAAAIFQLEAFNHLRKLGGGDLDAAYCTTLTMLQRSHAEARRLISGVRPPILDESGVIAAIEHLVHERLADNSPEIQIRSDVEFGRLAPILENAVYRIVQEGLTNACKHSQSELIVIGIVQKGDRLKIEIRDWGIGFNVKAARKYRFGIDGIRERARLLGGRCSIRSARGRGTSISVELPVVERGED